MRIYVYRCIGYHRNSQALIIIYFIYIIYVPMRVENAAANEDDRRQRSR